MFGDSTQDLVKPRRSKRSALRFLNSVANYSQQLVQHHGNTDSGHGYLKSALEQMCRITKPGSNVYLISDFSDYSAECQQYIQQLAMHNSMTCVLVYDALEEQLPRPGQYSITDGQRRSILDTHQSAVRELYQQDFAQRLRGLTDTFAAMQVPLLTIRTNQIVMEQLETWKQKTR